MKSRSLVVPSLALSLLLGGCASSGPNAQTGAVAGGTLGAIAGAIIGNNSHGGNGATGALIGAAFGAVTGGAIGSVKDEQHEAAKRYQSSVPYEAPQTQTVASAPVTWESHAPKPPRSTPPEDIPASPDAAAIWIPGYWDYNGASYVWMPGRWEIPPPDKHSYIAAHWEAHDTGHVFVRGYWE